MAHFELTDLIKPQDKACVCGRVHAAGISNVIIESGAIRRVPEVVRSYGASKVFVVADGNTYEAAGKEICALLEKDGMPYTLFCLPSESFECGEEQLGAICMHFDTSCDFVLGVGSGVINDLCKVVSNITDRPYVIFGTAPSMDGYASSTSSVIKDRFKTSIQSRVGDTVIADLDILCKAPMRMILSGLGDMLAKYISIAEWKIANIVRGDYFCPQVADMMLDGLAQCMEHLDGLPKRDPEAIKAVMNGMVLSGIAANYTGGSAPASGMEHYFSHISDLRGIEFGATTDLHGIQCGAATIETLALYEKMRTITPDKEKALAYAAKFNYEDWKKVLYSRLGSCANGMVAAEEREHKYDVDRHRERLGVILAHWEEIRAVFYTLPTPAEIEDKLRAIGLPTRFTEIGFSEEDLHYAILMSKDIRDKYVGTRLLWDLGILEEIVG